MMIIFISHSTKDEALAKMLSSFLESVDSNIEVFCTSQVGSIDAGRNFPHEITNKLNRCDVFIPLLSVNYYESRFSMIELGFSYSCLYNKYIEHQGNYIYPLTVSSIKKAEALAGTPLSNLQIYSINDAHDMRAYIESICNHKNIHCPSGLNKRINKFIADINQIIFEKFDILNNVKIFVCKSGEVPGEDGDYLSYESTDKCEYIVKFIGKPFNNSNTYPVFLSFVLKFLDKIDLYTLLSTNKNAKLSFNIDNTTNSLSKINIEIKCSNNNNILHRETIFLQTETTSVDIELSKIESKALKYVSEICFVITPSAYLNDKGVFKIKNFRISF